MSSTLVDKRVIVLLPSLSKGGAEKQAIQFAHYLKTAARADVRVWCFFDSPENDLAERCRSVDIPITILWDHARPTTKRGWLVALQGLMTRLKKADIDILLPYMMLPNALAGIVFRQAGIPLCVWGQRDSGGDRLPGWIERQAVASIPLYMANSRPGEEFLRDILRVDPDKIHIVPNGVELTEPVKPRDAWRQEWGVDDDTLVVCMVANITTYKDHAALIAAWPPFQNEARLVCAGWKGDAWADVESRVAQAGLGQSVLFPGSVTDVSGLLHASDMMVHSTTQNDSCPNAVMEGMKAGLPILASDTPGIRDVLGADDALYFKPGDSKGLAEKLRGFLQAPQLRHQAGQANLERVNEFFSTDKAYGRMSDIIARAYHEACA